MPEYKLTLPEMGEGVAEATVIKWLKAEGDSIALDESVLEIATDKVDSDIPSPVEGKLSKKLVQPDDRVKVGQAVALIEVEAQAQSDELDLFAEEASAPTEEIPGLEEALGSAVPESSSEGRFYSPLVKTIAREEGISQLELDGIQGSGANGRVTKRDVLAYLEVKKSASVEISAPASVIGEKARAQGEQPAAQAPKIAPAAEDEIIEMDRMRRLIAEHMVQSKRISPHVTSFVEADVTSIAHWRNRIKEAFFAREGEKITYTPIFIRAVVQAIKDFPLVNASVEGNKIIKKKPIHIGMATALPGGNLIVPVIRNADQYSLSGLSKAVNDLARRARENRLKPDEAQGGTYTVTNLGSFGNLMGTPIINQPQVAILALGAIRKLPAVVETPQGDMIAIRQRMILSHAYDHRVVDGALGGLFVRRIADYLEAFDRDTPF